MTKEINEEEFNTMKGSTSRVTKGAISFMLISYVESIQGNEKIILDDKVIAFSDNGTYFKITESEE
jgi:hypothetical protein